MGATLNLHILDIIALVSFLCAWFGYSIFADYKSGNHEGNIYQIMHDYRLQWMAHTITRHDRSVDINAIANFVRTGVFFASTSVLIIAFLLPLLSISEQGIKVIEQIPFAYANSYFWEIKTILLLTIFIYAFFKYTWSIRQYNYAIAMILSIACIEEKKVKNYAEDITRNAKILSNAARHFGMGIRAYYFGLVTLSWFIHPILFILLTYLVIWILYRREFRSRALSIMQPS